MHSRHVSSRSLIAAPFAVMALPLLILTAGSSAAQNAVPSAAQNAGPSAAQTAAAPAAAQTSGNSGPARGGADATADATHPDFTGVWMAFAVENPDGESNRPDYSEQGEAMLDDFLAQYHEIPEPGAHCVGTGMPGVMLSLVSYPIEMVQIESRILMVAELETQVRRVFLDGREPPPNIFPTMVGYSVGSWEGDTLVIETTLLEPWELRPWPRSDEAEIVERFSLTTLDRIEARPSGFVGELGAAVSDEVLVVDITLTDPVYYDGPQRRIAYYQRVADEATAEYGCINGLWRDELDDQRIE